MAECENHVYHSDQSISGEMLVDRLESSLTTVEEGMQYLYHTSQNHPLLHKCNYNSLTQYLHLLMYGANDCIIPPIATRPYILSIPLL